MHDSSNLRYVLSKNVVTESPSVLTCVCVCARICVMSLCCKNQKEQEFVWESRCRCETRICRSTEVGIDKIEGCKRVFRVGVKRECKWA